MKQRRCETEVKSRVKGDPPVRCTTKTNLTWERSPRCQGHGGLDPSADCDPIEVTW